MPSPTEAQKIQEWLTRVADGVASMKKLRGTQARLAAIRGNYEVLAVMTKVANGTAQIQGIAPLIHTGG